MLGAGVSALWAGEVIRNFFRRITMKRRVFLCMVGMLLLLTTSAWSYDGTIATFADLAPDFSTPLFTVDGATVTGGWSDAQTGLNLHMVLTNHIYNNAFFTMDPLTLSNGMTGPGAIKFYDDGEIPAQISPLFEVDFQSAGKCQNKRQIFIT
jgi:hypothetical protein